MAAHACLKIDFMESDKCHDLMSWLNLEGLPVLFVKIDGTAIVSLLANIKFPFRRQGLPGLFKSKLQ